MLIFNLIKKGFILLIFLSLVGCSNFPDVRVDWHEQPCKPPPSKITAIDATFTSAHQLNPSMRGIASPITVYLYELKALEVFEKTDYFSLEANSKVVLGAELLAQDELKFEPEQARHYMRELQPTTRYFGIIAAYQDIDHAHWRTSVEIVPHEITKIVVRLDAKAISAKKVEKEALPDEHKKLEVCSDDVMKNIK